MATGSNWRSLSPVEKFNYLLNFHGTPEALAESLGVPRNTVALIARTISQGKTSHVLDRPDIQAAIPRARHRMTDALRRMTRDSQAGRFESPLVRVGPTFLQPERYQVQLGDSGISMTSNWLSYHVEHLPFTQIVEIARHLFELYMETGQFNIFRFEYIADASVYLSESILSGSVKPRRSFKNKSLNKQFLHSDIIKLSTRSMYFSQFEGNPIKFEDDFIHEWEFRKTQGAIRIVDLVFAFSADQEKTAMPEVRADYRKWQRRNNAPDKKRGSDGKRGSSARKPRKR